MKAKRSNRLDLDIRNKTKRSQSLDDAIEAKRKEVTKLEAKADEKLQDFYTIKERGDWQDPMFFAMSAYIYRIDEGLRAVGCLSLSVPFTVLSCLWFILSFASPPFLLRNLPPPVATKRAGRINHRNNVWG